MRGLPRAGVRRARRGALRPGNPAALPCEGPGLRAGGGACAHTCVCVTTTPAVAHRGLHSPAQTTRAGPLLGVGWGAGAVVFEPRRPWRGRQPSRHLSLRPCDFVGDSDARGTPAPAPTPSLGRSEHLDRPSAAQAPSASLLRRRGGWALRRVAGPVAPVPGRAGFPWPSSPSVAPGLPCAPGHRRLPGRGPQRCGPGLPLPSTRASPSDVPSCCLARATAHSGQRSVSPF